MSDGIGFLRSREPIDVWDRANGKQMWTYAPNNSYAAYSLKYNQLYFWYKT